MNWGNRIFLVFVIFAGIIITMVVISFRQNIDLVAEDYYQQEIQYQDQIDRLENSQRLKVLPEFSYIKAKQKGILHFPPELQDDDAEGTIYLFRPSDARLDREFILKLNDQGKQTIALDNLLPGFWKVQIQWKQGGQEYYSEQTLRI